MMFHIRHRSTYTYGGSVTRSDHRLQLRPRDTQRQSLSSFELDVTPPHGSLTFQTDYFGNPIHLLSVEEPHDALVIEARSQVEVVRPRSAPMQFDTVADVQAAISRPMSVEALEAAEFAFPSQFTAANDAIEDLARELFPPDRPLMEAARELTARIFTDFDYSPAATTAATFATDAFAARHGVCQDFAHVYLAVCRSIGVPARYVSGYLLTHPPQGQEKLIGSDASHAWVAVWAPTGAWVDFDPTNNMLPGEEHITTAWGRDYGDVSPVNGVVLGGGGHSVDVAVDVIPINSDPQG
jgi:transglutaminase-like putative cysteine protease